ncbi:MAG: helix-turn-helix transcriptional regulator [Fimbriimonadaceae bacterium]|nr:helix-turn-helix transcriptional regulator [Fimbriimonadaceae bacterium]QYK56901.1 MAG: helix-turn-helix transcriptional regulator [Fimbriimonadaceae bacterium]
MSENVALVFRALGDPIRLEMLRRLGPEKPQPISRLSDGLGISRQGARKHLQVLVEAGLVCLRPSGRETLVELNEGVLDMPRRFVAELEERWDARLTALKRSLEEDLGTEKGPP